MKRTFFLFILFFCLITNVKAAYSSSKEYLYVGETFITTGPTCKAQTENVTAELNSEGKCVIKAISEGDYSVQLEYTPVENDVATEVYLEGTVLKDEYIILPEMIELASINSKTTEALKEELMSVSYLPSGATDVLIGFNGLSISVAYVDTSTSYISVDLNSWYSADDSNTYSLNKLYSRQPAMGGPELSEIIYENDVATRVANKLDLYLIEASPNADIAYKIITDPEKYALIKDVYEKEIRPDYLVVNSTNSSTSASLSVSFTLDGHINERIIAEYVKATDLDNTNNAVDPEEDEDEGLDSGPATGAFTEYYVWFLLAAVGLILLVYNKKKIIKL